MTFALEIERLSKVYDGGYEAIKSLTMRVKKGSFFALLGPNGAGKSTLINIIVSLVQKTSGHIRVFGKDYRHAKHYFGIVPQEFNFNVFEKVYHTPINQAGYYGIERTQAKKQSEKYLRLLGLWEKRDEQALSLSGGMKRRLMLARALVHEPEILILDEPTAGVDIELRRSLWQILRDINRSGKTIILTTHYLEEAESLCRDIGIIDQGSLIEQTTIKQLLRRLKSQVFEVDTLDALPLKFKLAGYAVSVVDEHCFAVEIDKSVSLNQLFASLNDAGIQALSIRSRYNRLEEIFMMLLQGKRI